MSLEIPAGLFEALEKESKRKRRTVARMLAELLEDMQDAREAEKRIKEIRSGKVETVPWEEAKKRILEAP